MGSWAKHQQTLILGHSEVERTYLAVEAGEAKLCVNKFEKFDKYQSINQSIVLLQEQAHMRDRQNRRDGYDKHTVGVVGVVGVHTPYT